MKVKELFEEEQQLYKIKLIFSEYKDRGDAERSKDKILDQAGKLAKPFDVKAKIISLDGGKWQMPEVEYSGPKDKLVSFIENYFKGQRDSLDVAREAIKRYMKPVRKTKKSWKAPT